MISNKKSSKPRPRWYSARILIESRSSDGRPLSSPYEDRLILVRALSETEATRKAKQLARAVNEEYEAMAGNTVIVRFKRVPDVFELFDDRLAEGTEVYYQFLNRTQLRQVFRKLRIEFEV